MENNWKEKAEEILMNHKLKGKTKTMKKFLPLVDYGDEVEAMLEFGNLVFESTKEECADKSEAKFQFFTKKNVKESVRNINKPNL